MEKEVLVKREILVIESKRVIEVKSDIKVKRGDPFDVDCKDQLCPAYIVDVQQISGSMGLSSTCQGVCPWLNLCQRLIKVQTWYLPLQINHAAKHRTTFFNGARKDI